MAINVDFSALQQAVDLMGPYDPDFQIQLDNAFEEVDIDLSDGREVTPEDVVITSGGLISVFGQQAVLYIPDQGSSLWDVMTNGVKSKGGKRVHLANCSTINSMKEANRYERYVARNGLSQKFAVTGSDAHRYTDENRMAHLAVCQNCLSKLNYHDFRSKNREQKRAVVEDFAFDAFFARYSSYFTQKPKELLEKYAANTYVDEWQTISRRVRREANFCCSECKLDLKERKHLLHVHHINGNRNDNATENLSVLCVDCHSKAPLHDSMFVSSEHRRQIQSMRIEQNLYTPTKGSRSDKAWDEAFEQSDPAVHDLLLLRKRRNWEAPEVGGDVVDHQGEIVYSNAELVWEQRKQIVDIVEQDKTKVIALRWRVLTVADALEYG